MTELTGKTIVLGVCGGIAAYKAAELVRLFVKAGASVHVVMTENGTRFVTPTTFQALSGNPVWTSAWDDRRANSMSHIELTRMADLLLIAPATANMLAKLAGGIADDLLSTLALARACPLLVAPAMNRQMWGNPATRRNVAQLLSDGIALIGPDSGSQACGEVGEGRMSEPTEICEAVKATLSPKLMAGRTVVMTVGPTYEPIDPVRGITNISSGKMGFALARALTMAGASVKLVSGPVALPTPYGVTRIDVRSAREMHLAVMQNVGQADVFIGVAAVADYRVSEICTDKIKKSDEKIHLELVKNPDILAEVAALPAGPFCVGFAAESRNLDDYAESKRKAKGLGLVVGNLVQDAMGGDNTQVVLYDAHGRHPVEPGSKELVAGKIVTHLSNML